MAGYTDVFVVPVPKKSVKAYREQAELFSKVWLEHGALSCEEIEADDVKPGKVTSFPQSVSLKPGETVFVGLITYKSRKHRDEVNAKAMKDPRMKGMDPKSIPYDGMRMFFGGFKPFAGNGVDEAGAATAKRAGKGVARVQPYLFFKGRCDEALAFYKTTLGAELLPLMRFSDNPEPPQPGKKLPAEWSNKVMHASMRIGETEVMVSDGMPGGDANFQGVSLTIAVDTPADADRIYTALAKGGKIQMPIGKTFFSPRFGAVKDKFGVSWMVIAQ